MAIEQTLIIIKPDAVERRLIGEIIRRFEAAGLQVKGLQMLQMDQAQAETFYSEHRGKAFFEQLVDYMTSGACVTGVVEGKSAIARVRELMGATNPAEAQPGTIRAELGQDHTRNSVHGSDSPGSAKREIAFFFPQLAVD